MSPEISDTALGDGKPVQSTFNFEMKACVRGAPAGTGQCQEVMADWRSHHETAETQLVILAFS